MRASDDASHASLGFLRTIRAFSLPPPFENNNDIYTLHSKTDVSLFRTNRRFLLNEPTFLRERDAWGWLLRVISFFLTPSYRRFHTIQKRFAWDPHDKEREIILPILNTETDLEDKRVSCSSAHYVSYQNRLCIRSITWCASKLCRLWDRFKIRS